MAVIRGHDHPAAMAGRLGVVGGFVHLLHPGGNDFRRVGIEGQGSETLRLPEGGPDMHRDPPVRHDGEAAFPVIDGRVEGHNRLRPVGAIVHRSHGDDGTVGVHVVLSADEREKQVAIGGPHQRGPRAVVRRVLIYYGMGENFGGRGHG